MWLFRSLISVTEEKKFYGSFYFFMEKILFASLILFTPPPSKVLIASIILGVEIAKSLAFCVFLLSLLLLFYIMHVFTTV